VISSGHSSKTVFTSKYLFPVCCALAFLFPIAACLGANSTRWALILLRLPDFLILILWLTAATGLGAAILKIARYHATENTLLHLVISTALGLGILSLLTLLLGLFTSLPSATAWTLLAAGLLACAFARDTLLPTFNQSPTPLRYLLLLPLASLGLSSIAALLPPGILWGDEPNGYDVLEYHLQIPREWYELHRIVPLHHNVFSFFPMNVEMHYLLAMALRAGPWNGMYLAQLMHVAFLALTAVAVYALIAERSKSMAIVAATAVATVPWFSLLAPVAYDEGGLLLWGTLAIGLYLREPRNWRSMFLAGVMAGFACGSKLTAVPIVLLAVPAIHVMMARFKPAALAGAASYFLAGCVVFSPWLVKDIAWTGNPVFPEETSLFGRGNWSQTQVDRWVRANHLPRPDQQNLRGRTAAAWDQVIGDWRFGFVLLPLAVVSAVIARKDRQTVFLVLLLLTLSVFWLFFTHLQSRFFALAIPISALLIGAMRPQRAVCCAYSIIVVLAGVGGLIAVYVKLSSINDHLFDFIGMPSLIGLTPLADGTVPLLDNTIPADASVHLIGEARAFLYDVPSGRLFYRTVFDVEAKPNQFAEDAWRVGWPATKASTIEVVDGPELVRFGRTYFGIPRPSPDVEAMGQAVVRWNGASR
jgi:hypothetical protein